MAYKVEQIEGIGEVYAEKLNAVGIKTTDELLAKCATSKGRKELEEATGIAGGFILKWTNHADLMRINGVAGQFSELLEAAGVDTVKELKHRVPANLKAKLDEVNAQKNLVNRVPGLPEIEKMIEQAKQLEPIMTY